MKTSKSILSEREQELVELLMADCQSMGDIQSKLKRLFAGTIEQMLEVEMDEHLGYDKNSVLGNNSGNSRNGYKHKTIISDYGSSEIAVPRDRNGEFEPKVLAKRQEITGAVLSCGHVNNFSSSLAAIVQTKAFRHVSSISICRNKCKGGSLASKATQGFLGNNRRVSKTAGKT